MEGMEDGGTRPRQVRYVFGNLRAENRRCAHEYGRQPRRRLGLARPLVLSLGRIPGDNSPIVQQSYLCLMTGALF